MTDKEKPTIAELEKILNSEDPGRVHIAPDGQLIGLSSKEEISRLEKELAFFRDAYHTEQRVMSSQLDKIAGLEKELADERRGADEMGKRIRHRRLFCCGYGGHPPCDLELLSLCDVCKDEEKALANHRQRRGEGS